VKDIYVLHHINELENEDDIKLIGVYSTEEKAKQAISKLSSQPGFVQSKEGFHIEKYEIDKDHWCEGFVTIKNN
jgi:hypothetical protein